MMRKKNIIIGVALLLTFGLVFMNLIYPFSYFSVSQSIDYKPSKGLAQGYNESVEQLEKQSTGSSTNNFVESHTEFILDNFNQILFIDPDGTKIKRVELEQLIADVREIRYLLIDLAFREEYSELGDSFLKNAILKSASLEFGILNIMSSRFYSKKEIEISLRNIQVEFRSTMDLYKAFYEEYKSK
jgi:hypothetical protein